MHNPTEELSAKAEGFDTPTGSPHLCPYRRQGADKRACLEMTTIYLRNLAACCGTQDSRDFGPCNFVHRKCVTCLADGKGAKANEVSDVRRGLCEDHLAAPEPAEPPKLLVQIRPVPQRVVPDKIDKQGAATLPKGPKPQSPTAWLKRKSKEEKVLAFCAASKELWEEGGKQDRPLSRSKLVERAFHKLDRAVRRSSLNVFLSSDISIKDREILLKPHDSLS